MLQEQGLAGPISFDRYDGRRLPYVDNLVNLLVVDGPDVSTDLQSIGSQTVAEQQWNSFEAVLSFNH